MISPRPIPWSVGEWDGSGIMDAHGHQIAVTEGPMQLDAATYIVACVNAFHEAGIDPADLPKFVEAVRKQQQLISFMFDQPANNATDDMTLGEARGLSFEATMAAAACLPENKETKT